jgi:PAS domain S-box-containing protein
VLAATIVMLALCIYAQFQIGALVSISLASLVVVRQLVTVRHVVEVDRERLRSEARFDWLVKNSSDLIMAVDASRKLDYVSPSVKRLLGAGDGKLLGALLTGLAHPEDVGAVDSLLDRAMRSPGERIIAEWRLHLGDGTWLPVETVATSGLLDGDAPGVALNTRDLRERKALEQKLTFQAFHDPLTRLANRSLFRERVEHALERRQSGDTAVLFIDLDNFKTINDSLGHACGVDLVLLQARVVAARNSPTRRARAGTLRPSVPRASTRAEATITPSAPA